MDSKISIRGTLRIYELDPVKFTGKPKKFHRNSPFAITAGHVREGSVRKVVETSNLITDIGLQALACLIAGGLGVHSIDGSGYGDGNFQNLRVAQMRLTNAAGPAAPAPADNALSIAPVWTFADDYPMSGNTLMSAEQLITAGEVKFAGLIPQHEQVGVIFSEEGLFSQSGQLIARTTFSYTKTQDTSVQLEHTISIARA